MKVFSAGYPAWVKYAGVKKKAAPQIKQGGDEGVIELKSFLKILKENPQSILLVDVRDADEYKAGHFKTAVNIPLDDLEKKLKTWKVTKPVVFVCNTGSQSGEAFYMVMDQRPDLKGKVFFLEAETTYNADGTFKIKPAH